MRLFLPDNSLFLIQYSKLLCDYHFKHFSRRIIFPIPTGKPAVIKPLPGNKKTLEQLKPKPFRARPVPRSHYNEPYRPELPSKKDLQPKIAAKKVDTAHPGFKMVDPILHPNDNVEDTRISQGKPVEKVITAEVSLSPEAIHRRCT